MTEHCPGPEQQADPTKDLRCVTLPEIPIVYALYHPEDEVTAWVLALPGGHTILVPIDEDGETYGTGLTHTDLDGVVSRWAPYDEADLVLVTT